jgi:C4-dicarboxylate-binding protein DctP
MNGASGTGMALRALALAALVAAAPARVAAQDGCDAGEVEWKFSLVTAVAGHPKGEAALAFAETMNRHFEGRACVRVYGNTELYDDDDALYDAMLAGEVAFAAPAIDKLDRFTGKLALLSLPFLFDGPLHALEFLNSDAVASIDEDFAAQGFHAFGFWSNGMRQMSATVPIRSVTDAAGLTFRVSNGAAITAAIYEAMNVRAVEMPFARVYDALRSGEVQGQENTWSNIESQQFFEVQAAITETNHNYLGYLAMTTGAFLDALPPADRQFVVDAMALVTHERNRFAFELNQISRRSILEEGGRIITLSPAELEAFREAFRPVVDRFRDEIGGDLIDAAIRVNAEARPFD